jgi:hypothetical protein
MDWRKWLSELFCEEPGEPSIRRVVFALSFLFAVVVCFMGLRVPVSDSVKDIVITIITAAFSVMGIGRIAEALDKR